VHRQKHGDYTAASPIRTRRVRRAFADAAASVAAPGHSGHQDDAFAETHRHYRQARHAGIACGTHHSFLTFDIIAADYHDDRQLR